MDKIKISKVEDVILWRKGSRVQGTLFLAPHHLVFSYIPPQTTIQQEQSEQAQSAPSKPKELWIAYPIISFCTYKPVHPTSHQQASIRLRCRDFTFVALCFDSDAKARDAFETIRNLTCRLNRLEKLYAFSYQAQGPEKPLNGWTIYDPMREWARQGVGVRGANRGWRISEINREYEYSPTYPALLPVPASISDNVLKYGGPYRSRVRIPALTYLHPINDCSITRSSQPLVGVRQHRSVQDERLVAAIFSTSKPKLQQQQHLPPVSHEAFTNSNDIASPFQSGTSTPSKHMEEVPADLEALEDIAIAQMGKDTPNRPVEDLDDVPTEEPRLYGAQQHNLIIDARPTVNAYAMQAVGMGSENMDHYKFATKAYLGIDNIHVMRDSLNKVIDAIKDSDMTPLPPNGELLAKSGWLKHISNMLEGATLIARQVGIHHSHVLIHCSDGWDRTGQLSALSQICLDPYFRTIEGFIVLVEKDWLSFGHMFRTRSGFLGSEKWFEVEGERISNQRLAAESTTAPVRSGSNPFESALLSARGLFNKHHNDSRESLVESDGEVQALDSSPSNKTNSPSSKRVTDDKQITKLKEVSPVFHQFLDATYQILCQHPTRFEFNERFLRRLLYQLYSCQYGTFLYDNEKQRKEAKVSERTRSVWDYFLARKEQFINEQYDPAIDEYTPGKERLIFSDSRAVKWWFELFGRTDEEMNKPIVSNTHRSQNGSEGAPFPDIDTMDNSQVIGSTAKPGSNGTTELNGANSISAHLANLSFDYKQYYPSLKKSSSAPAKDQKEVEMQ